jgi:hypothetical protein
VAAPERHVGQGQRKVARETGLVDVRPAAGRCLLVDVANEWPSDFARGSLLRIDHN